MLRESADPGRRRESPWTRLRQSHPRPALVRQEWLSLDGEWEFALDDDGDGRAQGWHQDHPLPARIRVPFAFEAPLSGLGLGDEVHPHVWYR